MEMLFETIALSVITVLLLLLMLTRKPGPVSYTHLTLPTNIRV